MVCKKCGNLMGENLSVCCVCGNDNNDNVEILGDVFLSDSSVIQKEICDITNNNENNEAFKANTSFSYDSSTENNDNTIKINNENNIVEKIAINGNITTDNMNSNSININPTINNNGDGVNNANNSVNSLNPNLIQPKNNNSKVVLIIILLIIIIAVIFGVSFIALKSGKLKDGNDMTDKYTVRLKKINNNIFELKDTKTIKLSTDGLEQPNINYENYEIYKINDYITLYNGNYSEVEISNYNHELNKEKKDWYLTFGNVKYITFLSLFKSKVLSQDASNLEEYNDMIKNAKTVYELAVDFSVNEEEIKGITESPTISKISDSKSVVKLVKGTDEVEYVYFIEVDTNNYYEVSLRCLSGYMGFCSEDSEEFQEIKQTFDKLNFEVVE